MTANRARAASDEWAGEVVGAAAQCDGNGSPEHHTAHIPICWDDELDWIAQTPHLELLRHLLDHGRRWLAADPHDSMLVLELEHVARRVQ